MLTNGQTMIPGELVLPLKPAALEGLSQSFGV